MHPLLQVIINFLDTKIFYIILWFLSVGHHAHPICPRQ